MPRDADGGSTTVTTRSVGGRGPLLGAGIAGALVVAATVAVLGGADDSPDATGDEVADDAVAVPDAEEGLPDFRSGLPRDEDDTSWGFNCGDGTSSCATDEYWVDVDSQAAVTVAASDDDIVTVGPDGGVIAFEADGTRRWAQQVETDDLPQPTLLGDAVAIRTADATVVLDLDDGEVRWEGPRSMSVDRADDTVLLADLTEGADGDVPPEEQRWAVIAYDADDGQERWRQDDLAAAAPLPSGAVAIVDERLRGLDADGATAWERDLDGADPMVTPNRGLLQLVRDRRPVLLDPADGSEVDLPAGVGSVRSVDGDDVLTTLTDVELVRDGEVAWTADGANLCDVHWDDDRVVLFGCDGTDVELDREDGTELARSEVDAVERIGQVVPLSDGELDRVGRVGPLAHAQTDNGLVVVDVRGDERTFELRASGQSRVVGAPQQATFDDATADPQDLLVSVPTRLQRFVPDVPLYPSDDVAS